VAVGDPSEGSFERRGGLRATASIKVSYTSIGELVEAYTEDLSRGGLYVRTDEPLPIGAVVQLHVALPDSGPAFDVFARVAHVIGAEGRAGGRVPGMGLEFLDIGAIPLADEIVRYLAAQGHDVPVPPPPSGISASVLVVDHDEKERERIASVVRDSGHSVETAKNGMDGLRKALDDTPDLIVSEVKMPALDGWQFIRLVRARPQLAHVPVVFVTGTLSDEDRLAGYKVGVSDYVGKPFEDDELALQLQRVLERFQAYPGSSTRACLLSGELSHVSIGRVLSLLAAESREGRLMLVHRDQIATAYLRSGDVVRIDVPDEHEGKTGAERLFYLLDWVDGRFEFSIADVTDDDDIGLPTAQALIQHAHLHEEEPTNP